MQHVHVFGDDLLRLGIALVNDPLHLGVDHAGHVLAVLAALAQLEADEHVLVAVAVADHADLIRHAVLRDHGPGNVRGLLDIL